MPLDPTHSLAFAGLFTFYRLRSAGAGAKTSPLINAQPDPIHKDMPDNVIDITRPNPADNPDVVLDAAKGKYQDVMLVGYNQDGDIDVRMSKDMNLPGLYYMLSQLRHAILDNQ